MKIYEYNKVYEFKVASRYFFNCDLKVTIEGLLWIDLGSLFQRDAA